MWAPSLRFVLLLGVSRGAAREFRRAEVFFDVFVFNDHFLETLLRAILEIFRAVALEEDDALSYARSCAVPTARN